MGKTWLHRLLLRGFLAVSFAIGLVMGGGMAYAYWQATATSGAPPVLKSGTFDLTAGPTTGFEALLGAGGTYTWDVPWLTNLYPGESFAQTLPIGNNGDAGMTVTVAISGTQTGFDNNLTITAYGAGAASNSGAVGARQGSCSGTLLGATNITVPATLGTTFYVPKRAASSLCLIVSISPTMPGPPAVAPTANLSITLSAVSTSRGA